MEIVAADALSLEQLTEAWNLVYTGYFVPIHLTPEQLADHVLCGDIDVPRSIVAREGGSLVGLSLLGVRDGRGWIGGFGIAPDFRGRGLSHRLFAEHMDRIRTDGPPSVQLEVFVQNWARKVYDREGFVVTRRLSVLRGRLPGVAREGSREPGGRETSPPGRLRHHDWLHAGWPLAWNREAAWLEKSFREGDRTLAIGPAEAPRGVVHYRRAESGPRVLDASAEEDAGSELVSALAAVLPGEEVLLVNEPEGSPVQRALLAAGCIETLVQHEMLWTAGAGDS